MKIRNHLVSALLTAAVMTTAGGFAAAAPVAVMAQTNQNDGSIIVNKAVDNETYSVYQIMELESYNAEDNAYAYKITPAWKAFADTADAKKYFSVDAQGYATWTGDRADAQVQTFVRAALAYAEKNGIKPTKTKKASGGCAKFTGLGYGYYAVDSSIGSVCMLDSANPKMNIDEKNTGTTNEKLVFEDGYGYQHMSDSYVGGTVTFKSTISVATDGPKNLSFHDKMEEGLTFDSGSVTVTKEGSNTSLAADVDYVLTTKAADGCTFEVNFTESCTDALKAGDKLNVDYRATLNENAKVNGPNRNESYIKYGNSTFTPPSVTRTYTWSFDVFKYTNNNGEKALAGAEFTLKKADDNWKAVGSAIRFKKTGEGTYLCAAEGDTSSLVTEKNGKLNLAGLERGNYLLEEIKAPDGYNKLEKPVKVEIVAEPANANTELVSKIMTENGNGSFKEAASGTVKVLNVTGTLLPSTGGMGTTVFYFAGAILVLGGGIVLIARKRAASVD